MWRSNLGVCVYLSSLVQVDEPPSEVVRVTVADKSEVFEKHSNIRDSWRLCISQVLTVALIIVLQRKCRV